MSNCSSPWSGQDEFVLYNDCHVWVPLYRISYGLICIIALLNFFMGYLRVSQGKGPFAICLTAYSFWLAIACGIRLTTGWVIGNRNVALNMTCALTLVFFWCGLSLYVLKYLDLIFQTDTLKGRSQEILGRARQLLHLFMILTIVLQIFNLVVPTLSEADFVPTLWITIYFQATFLSVLFLFYGLKARALLKSISLAGETYQVLLERLDFVLVPWTVCYLTTTVVIALLLFADIFVRNQYILMPFTWGIEAAIAAAVLIATRNSNNAHFGGVELDSQKMPTETPGNSAHREREHSRLSDSRSQHPSEVSTHTSATTTPNLPSRHMAPRFSPLLASTASTITPTHLARNLTTPESPVDDDSHKFRFNRGLYQKGMERLEEGEWVSNEEVMSLTIDTTDRNPKPITMIEIDPEERV